jgi:hypothetical protein
MRYRVFRSLCDSAGRNMDVAESSLLVRGCIMHVIASPGANTGAGPWHSRWCMGLAGIATRGRSLSIQKKQDVTHESLLSVANNARDEFNMAEQIRLLLATSQNDGIPCFESVA